MKIPVELEGRILEHLATRVTLSYSSVNLRTEGCLCIIIYNQKHSQLHQLSKHKVVHTQWISISINIRKKDKLNIINLWSKVLMPKQTKVLHHNNNQTGGTLKGLAIRVFPIEVEIRIKQIKSPYLRIRIHWSWITKKGTKLINRMTSINQDIRNYLRTKMKT